MRMSAMGDGEHCFTRGRSVIGSETARCTQSLRQWCNGWTQGGFRVKESARSPVGENCRTLRAIASKENYAGLGLAVRMKLAGLLVAVLSVSFAAGIRRAHKPGITRAIYGGSGWNSGGASRDCAAGLVQVWRRGSGDEAVALRSWGRRDCG